MRTLGKTAQIYLQEFERLPESDIARKAGVSRQRIHRLERKFKVCTMAPSGSIKLIPRPCPTCGKQMRLKGRKYCSMKCRVVSTLRVSLTCPICGKEFVRRWSDVKKYKKNFCSKHCHGVYVCRIRWGEKTERRK